MTLNVKEVIKPAAILVAICVVVSAALAGTNLLTEKKIEEQAALKAEASRKIVLPGADSFEEMSATQTAGAYHTGLSGGETVGYVFETSAKGYGGDVKIMTGISAEGDITGVVILSHSETPGLGANAEKEGFRDQYKQPAPDSGIELVKFQAPAEGQIEAMTGATITSTAVTDAVNAAIDQFHQAVGGGDYDG